VAEQFIDHNSKDWKITTLELYRSQMKHLSFFNDLLMTDINSYTVDEWLKWLRRPEYLMELNSSRVSFGNELTLLKQIFTHYREYVDESAVPVCLDCTECSGYLIVEGCSVSKK